MEKVHVNDVETEVRQNLCTVRFLLTNMARPSVVDIFQ